MQVTIIPIVNGAFGTVTKGLLKGLEDLEVGGRVETIQTTTLSRTARILKRELETSGDLLSLKLLWKTIGSRWYEKLWVNNNTWIYLFKTGQQGPVLYQGDKGVNVAACSPEGGPPEAGDLSASNLPLISIPHPARMPGNPRGIAQEIEIWPYEQIIILEGLVKGLEDLEIIGRVKTIQTTALLRSARILRRVLETWGDLLSFKLQWKTVS